MIFYTLKGPGQRLEIHDDRMVLSRFSWFGLFKSKHSTVSWELHNLSYFAITTPKLLMWGKIEWNTFDGKPGCFRFSTNALMVQKIEQYLQKKAIKNHNYKSGLEIKQVKETKKSKRERAERAEKAAA